MWICGRPALIQAKGSGTAHPSPAHISCKSRLAIDPSVDPANLLIEKISQVVHEHHELLAHLEDEELVRLRTEILELRCEVERLSQVAESPNQVPRWAPALSPRIADSCDIGIELSPDMCTSHSPPGVDWEPCRDIPIVFETEEKPLVSQTGLLVRNDETKQPQLRPRFENLSSGSLMSGISKESEMTNVRTLLDASPRHHKSNYTVGTRCQKSNEAEMIDLRSKFCELDYKQQGFLEIDVLADEMLKDVTDPETREERIAEYKNAVYKVNKKLGILGMRDHSSRKAGKFNIHFATFQAIMLDDLTMLQEELGPSVKDTILQLRHQLIHDVLIQQIAQAWHIDKDQVTGHAAEMPLSCLRKALEPAVGILIIANSLCLGLSLDHDPDWKGWFVFELIFTLFFLTECLVRIYLNGLCDHFAGDAWAWNCFDFFIVISALIDCVFTICYSLGVEQMKAVDLRQLLLLRLVRIIRITRLIRILRLKVFKELKLMVNGVIAGLRTLFWAIVLLAIFVYALGVLMRQLMSGEHNDRSCHEKGTSHFYEASGSETCNRGEATMDEFGPYMFSSVPRAMLAILTCFTDGCGGPDGTPLIWHLWDTHGPLLVLGYVASFLFISFGVLNLIMAVFVENTLRDAQKSDAERQFGEQALSVKKAHELQHLLIRFCTQTTVKRRRLSTVKAGLQGIFEQLSSMKSGASSNDSLESVSALQMRITQEQFEEILADAEVSDILDDLDISCISREQLFDILDADGNGYLAISELVNGIMKLRGPADKGDGVASVLMIRQVQKQLSKFEESFQPILRRMEKSTRRSDRKVSFGEFGHPSALARQSGGIADDRIGRTPSGAYRTTLRYQ